MSNFYYSSITLEQILTFLNVAQTLNMRKSATDLAVTQSAISKRIAAIEAASGLILFTKYKNHLRLTPAGQYLYENLEKKYDSIAVSFDHALLIQKNSRQMFTLGVPPSFPPTVALSALEEIHRRYPSVDVNLKVDSTEFIAERLLAREFDAVVIPTVYVENDPAVQYSVFETIPLYVGLSRESPLLRQENCTLETVLSGPFVIPSSHYSGSSALARDVFSLVDVNRRSNIIEVESPEAIFYNLFMGKGASVVCGLGSFARCRRQLLERLVFFSLPERGYKMGLCVRRGSAGMISEFQKVFAETIAVPENREVLRREYSGFLEGATIIGQ